MHDPGANVIKETWEVHYQTYGGDVIIEGPFSSFSRAMRCEDMIIAKYFGALSLVGVRRIEVPVLPMPPDQVPTP